MEKNEKNAASKAARAAMSFANTPAVNCRGGGLKGLQFHGRSCWGYSNQKRVNLSELINKAKEESK